MAYKPRISGVDYSTPAADKVDACKVDWVQGTPKGGWTLTVKDAEGNLLRRFVDTNGDNRPDIWSYYKDGVEVYAEIDTAFTGKPDQYRWFNAGGSRWGVDDNKDGRIDSWKVISPEEVSQEILQALINHDFARLQPLIQQVHGRGAAAARSALEDPALQEEYRIHSFDRLAEMMAGYLVCLQGVKKLQWMLDEYGGPEP